MKAILRFVFISVLAIQSLPSFCQYWSENFEAYITTDKSLKFGYGWKNTATATGIKSIETRSLVSGNISPTTPGSFTTGFFLLENKKYTVNFQHKTGAVIITPLLKVLLVDANNNEIAEVFSHAYSNNTVKFSEFSFSGYTGWYKLRFRFSSTDSREIVQCGLDNINSTIPVNPETNSSVVLSDIQTGITMESPSPDKQVIQITFTNLGPDASLIEPASGTAILSDFKNIDITNYSATNLQFDPQTGQITFITHTAPDSFGVNSSAVLKLTLQQPANTPLRLSATINDISFQKDPNSANNTTLFVYDGADIPLNWKKTELSMLNKAVHIYWETLIEVNAHHYNIQRSEDGVNFTNIGTTLASNNSNSNTYYYNDYSITEGATYFYRLQLVNNNGATIFSPAQRITIPAANTGIKIYPTLIKSGAVISATTKQSGSYLVNILNSNIKSLMIQEVKVVNSKISVSTPANLKPGIYYLRLTNKTTQESVTQPFMVND